MGPPTVKPKRAHQVPKGAVVTNVREGSIQPKMVVKRLSSSNAIPAPSQQILPVQMSVQRVTESVSTVPENPSDAKASEGGLLQNITNIFKKSSSSSEASLAGLNAALVHRLYDPADLAMQDDKGRRYSHRAMHYLGDKIEDNDLCFITMKPRGLPADCTIKGNYVTVHRQNVILGPKGSQIEKLRLPVLKPEKTQSDDDNLLLLPGPSQYEATHHLVNPDDPEGYTEYLKAKAAWEKIRPASVSSGTSAKSSEDEGKLITKNLVREKLLKDREEERLKREAELREQQQREMELRMLEPEPEPEEPTEETVEVPVEDEEVQEVEPEPSAVVIEEPKEEEPVQEVIDENKENADGDNTNVAPEGEPEPVETEEEKIGDEEARMRSAGDNLVEPADIIEEKLPAEPPPPPPVKVPETPKPPPQIPKVPSIDKVESVDEDDNWLHSTEDDYGGEGEDDSEGYDYYGSGSNSSSKSKAKTKSKSASKKPKLSIKVPEKVAPVAPKPNPMVGNYGMTGMNPMMGGMGMMNPMMGMMNPMMGMGGGSTMGGMNSMDPFMMGIMMGMIPYLQPSPPPPPAYPYPCYPPPCYGYDYYGCGNYCCPPLSNREPCCYESSKKSCRRGKSKCHKKDKNGHKSKHHKKKEKKKARSKSATNTAYTDTTTTYKSRSKKHPKRSENRNKKIIHIHNTNLTNQNLNLEEDMNFNFLPQKGCCAEVTMTMDPDEPDPLLYAVNNNCMPVVCCQIPPTLMMNQPM